jgi:hypothetical protein
VVNSWDEFNQRPPSLPTKRRTPTRRVGGFHWGLRVLSYLIVVGFTINGFVQGQWWWELVGLFGCAYVTIDTVRRLRRPYPPPRAERIVAQNVSPFPGWVTWCGTFGNGELIRIGRLSTIEYAPSKHSRLLESPCSPSSERFSGVQSR